MTVGKGDQAMMDFLTKRLQMRAATLNVLGETETFEFKHLVSDLMFLSVLEQTPGTQIETADAGASGIAGAWLIFQVNLYSDDPDFNPAWYMEKLH